MRGPVGSLGAAEGGGYEELVGEGFTLLVEREVLAEISIPDVLRFHFGAFGWCEVRVETMDLEAEAASLRARRPRHILFLCVANSARSQMAEGLARALAPSGVRLSSAGSLPTTVRPEAVQVLAEIGVDISSHRSKDVGAVAASSVDAVITLCAEEVCPVFLGHLPRLHWGLPDPAAAPGSEADRLRAFRAVRDELRRRLEILFAGWS